MASVTGPVPSAPVLTAELAGEPHPESSSTPVTTQRATMDQRMCSSQRTAYGGASVNMAVIYTPYP
ncbi:hypothetical protein GCM10009753_02450 [Streptantibioticus ferralitis]